jgi:hypothetical protein
MPTSIGFRADYALALVDDEHAARRVAEVLYRPAFAALARAGALRTAKGEKHRWLGYSETTPEHVTSLLLDRANTALALDSGRSGARTASAQIESGAHAHLTGPAPESAYVVVPLRADQQDELIAGFCDLVAALAVRSAAIATEPSYDLAHRFALSTRAKPRAGMSERRQRERRCLGWHRELIDTQLSGPEWGTFLGPGHLARIDVGELRASGVFHRVVDVAPELVFLQLTADPADDLTDAFEAKLDRAREVLAPLLMDISAVTLD